MRVQLFCITTLAIFHMCHIKLFVPPTFIFMWTVGFTNIIFYAMYMYCTLIWIFLCTFEWYLNVSVCTVHISTTYWLSYLNHLVRTVIQIWVLCLEWKGISICGISLMRGFWVPELWFSTHPRRLAFEFMLQWMINEFSFNI